MLKPDTREDTWLSSSKGWHYSSGRFPARPRLKNAERKPQSMLAVTAEAAGSSPVVPIHCTLFAPIFELEALSLAHLSSSRRVLRHSDGVRFRGEHKSEDRRLRGVLCWRDRVYADLLRPKLLGQHLRDGVDPGLSLIDTGPSLDQDSACQRFQC